MIAQVLSRAHCRTAVIMVLVGALFAGCGKSDPPPDLIKTQRDAMERARAVSSVIDQSDQNNRKQIDQASQ
jgi:outer membrane PBP1 activator LpoA protein